MMLQAAVLECVSFDPFSFPQDCLTATEVDVGRCQIAQALMIASVVVMFDEPADAGFKIARQVVVLEQDAVLERLMPALDLALRLRMGGGAANVSHVLRIQPFSQLGRDVAGTIIAKQARLIDNAKLIVSIISLFKPSRSRFNVTLWWICLSRDPSNSRSFHLPIARQRT